MNKITELKLILSSILTYVFVSLSCHIESLPIAFQEIINKIGQPLIAIISILLGSFLSPLTVKMLTQVKTLRAIIMWGSWIDGYWLQKTFDENDNIFSNGLVEIIMTGKDFNDVFILAEHLRLIDKKKITSRSTDAFYNENTRHLINIFTRRIGGMPNETGTGIGHFSRSGCYALSPFPDSYYGDIKIDDIHNAKYRIELKKINKKEIDYAKRKYNDNWKEMYILELNTNSPNAFHLQNI